MLAGENHPSVPQSTNEEWLKVMDLIIIIITLINFIILFIEHYSGNNWYVPT